MAKKKVEEPVEEVVVTETPEQTAQETDPATHTLPRDNAVDPNSPQYVQ